MSPQNNAVFTAYTPLRNHLRKTKLMPSLMAIHAHIQHMQFSQELPGYIRNTPFGYNKAKEPLDFLRFHIFPWELEIIVKELLLHSPNVGEKTLEDWNYLAGSVNKLKALEGEIAKLYVTETNVLGELHRIAHRQFVWQRKPNHEDMARYWAIYSHPKLSTVVKNAIGLTVDEIYLIGYMLIGFYLEKFAIFYPPNIELPTITNVHFEKFLKHFCIPIDQLKSKLKNEQEMNDKYAYAYNSLKAFPLIKTEYESRDALICPIPTLLYRRLTEGLYYEICKESGFDEAFGNAFQDLIGDLLHMGNKKSKILPETVYGKPEKRTVDWIIEDSKSLLFIECKGKRLTYEAKTSLINNNELHKQLEIMADFVVQTYKSILDYQKGYYPKLTYNPSKIVYPLIVTSEEWYLFGHKLMEELDTKIQIKSAKQGIPIQMLQTNPYTICSVEGFNLLAQVSESITVNEILQTKNATNETKMWQLDTFIKNKFPKECSQTKNLLKNKFDKHIDGWLEKLRK